MSSERQSGSGSFREAIDELVRRIGGKEPESRDREQFRSEWEKERASAAFLLNEGLFRSSQSRE